MPFIWRSENALQTTFICLKESKKGHWVSENILCVFMVPPSTRWSGLVTSSEPWRAEAEENWKFKAMLGLSCSCSPVLNIHQLIPRQHGFPVTLCCIPQILQVKPLLLLCWLYWVTQATFLCLCLAQLHSNSTQSKAVCDLIWSDDHIIQLRKKKWSLPYQLHIWAIQHEMYEEFLQRERRTRSGQKCFG